jgi:hypothetical protein
MRRIERTMNMKDSMIKGDLLKLTCLGGVIAIATWVQAVELEPLVLELPAPAFKGTPKDLKVDPSVEPLSDKPRPAMMVPRGLSNLAKGKPVSASTGTASSSLKKVVDGDKEAYDTSAFLMKKGPQWVQIDMGETAEIFAVVIWHAHDVVKVYRDVIVQVSDDPDFKEGVTTLYNNDRDNSSGLGAGSDREYFETAEGRLIDARGVKGRYLRSHTNGSTDSVLNERVEIEVYGRPAK